MSVNLYCGFLGFGLINGRRNGGLGHVGGGGQGKIGLRRCVCEKQNNWENRRARFLNICGTNIELLKQKLSSGGGWEAKCVEESFVRGKDLTRSFSPLWREGIFLVRCSALIAVLSGVCLLVWYGRARAKSFVEAKLLPSVCSILSEYIQREIDVGKVKKISPLSITLESCAIGPHAEEFSCGEVPTLKLRLHPFASLRRGKIVIDAVVTNPTVLVVQKKDYTWLGIPSYEDGGLQRHLSSEEGINYRTKVRRIAREEAGTRWEIDRDNAALDAANMGYVIDEHSDCSSKSEDLKGRASGTNMFTVSDSFPCTDEGMHRRDHHCMDTGVQYDLKHANLEKSFGVKLPGSGLTFWSRIIPGPSKHKFKRKSNGACVSASVTCKQRILDRSQSVAVKYFSALSQRQTEPSGLVLDRELMDLDSIYGVAHEGNSYSSLVSNTVGENREALAEKEKKVESEENYVSDFNQEVYSLSDKKDFMSLEALETRPVLNRKLFGNQNRRLNLKHYPFVMTLERLTKEFRQYMPCVSEVASAVQSGGVTINNYDVEVDEKELSDLADKSNQNEPQQMESVVMAPNTQKVEIAEVSSFIEKEPWSSINCVAPNQQKSLKRRLNTSIEQFLSLVSPTIQKIKSGLSQAGKNSSQRNQHGNEAQVERSQRSLPIALDSVCFRGGTLMLLAYGDREPR